MRQVALVLIAGLAYAQPSPDELRRVLNAITVDARAIEQAPETQPPDSLVRLANEVDVLAQKVKLLAPATPSTQHLLVQLTESSARLVSDATVQDRVAIAGDTRDLIDTVARLRAQLPP